MRNVSPGFRCAYQQGIRQVECAVSQKNQIPDEYSVVQKFKLNLSRAKVEKSVLSFDELDSVYQYLPARYFTGGSEYIIEFKGSSSVKYLYREFTYGIHMADQNFNKEKLTQLTRDMVMGQLTQNRIAEHENPNVSFGKDSVPVEWPNFSGFPEGIKLSLAEGSVQTSGPTGANSVLLSEKPGNYVLLFQITKALD